MSTAKQNSVGAMIWANVFRGGRRTSVHARRQRAARFIASVESLENLTLLSTFTVTNINDAGVGTLRRAINDSNAAPGQTNTITFNIGSGLQRISLLSALPVITTPVVIDGSTAAGYSTSPRIALDGTNAGAGSNGLVFSATATGSVVKALNICSFAGDGIDVNADNVTLEANFIGTGAGGGRAYPNLASGIVVRASNVTIGGVNLLNPDGSIGVRNGNIVSGNGGSGVVLAGSGNTVQGNFIGVNAVGTAAIANGGDGVAVQGASSNIIGGNTPGAQNVISGNLDHGVSIVSTVTPPPTPYATSSGPLTLTQEGIDAGFTLATFATNFTQAPGGLGPAGIAFPASGGVLVSSFDGTVYKFPSAQNNQNAASVPSVSYRTYNTEGLAEVGGKVYMARQISGDLLEIDDSGNPVQVIVAGMGDATGVIADTIAGPMNGHLIVAAGPTGTKSIYDVDPVAKTKRLIANLGWGGDGMALDSKTNILYVALNGYGVVGYDLSTNQKVWDSGKFSAAEGSPDGLALGVGDLRGHLFVNTNGGTVVDVSLWATPTHTIIAHFGSRGDLATVDPNDGTMLLTQSSSIVRLIPPPGGSFLGGPATTTTGNKVEGNLIGLGFDGKTPLGNTWAGVFVAEGATANTIGGSGLGQGNTIAANGGNGVRIVDRGTNNLVAGNAIGTNAAGTLAAGNKGAGVMIDGGATSNTVTQNLVANNAQTGVSVFGTSTTGNAIQANSIFANIALGIDLGEYGVTTNGSQPAPGPNNWQQFPVLTSAVTGATGTEVTGTAQGAAGQNVTIDFYANDAADPSGYGEGKTWLGSTTATAGSPFQATLPLPAKAGQWLSATETSASGDTSEFSANLPITTETFTVNLTSTLGTSVYGQSVGFTAALSSTHTPTGTVQFQIDGVNLGPAISIDPTSGLAASSTISTLDAGTHTVTAVYSGDSVHTRTTATTIQTVKQAHLTVTADSQAKLYGDVVPALTYTVTGFVNGDTSTVVSGLANLTTTATKASGVGSYPIVVSAGSLGALNYDFSNLVNGALTVSQAHLTVMALNLSKSTGTANPTLTYSISGFVNGDTAAMVSGSPLLSTTATTSSPAGSYPITVEAGSLSAANYDFPNLVSGTLSVTDLTVLPLTVSATRSAPVYGQAIAFTATLGLASGGNPGGAVQFQVDGTSFGTPVPVVNGVATSKSISSLAAGSHVIMASYSGDANYASASATFDLVEAKARLTVAARSISVPYNSPIPALTYQITGFFNGDTAALINGMPILTTTAAQGSSVVGSPYPITVDVTGITATNYDFVGVNGLLTVVRIPSTTALAVTGSALPGVPMTFTSTVQPGAGTNNDGSVTFTDNGQPLGSVAVVGGKATYSAVLTPGSHTIVAVYSGGTNLSASTSAPTSVVIAQPRTGDVTSAVNVQLSAPTRIGRTNKYSQMVTITANPGQVIAGPIEFILKGLSSSIKVSPLAGMTKGPKRTQSPYMRFAVTGSGLLTPGGVVSGKLTFSAKPNRYTPIVWAGPVNP